MSKRILAVAATVGKGERYMVCRDGVGIASLWAADYVAADRIATELFGQRGWCLGTYASPSANDWR